MALLDYTDLEQHDNITLTDPEGRDAATQILAGVEAWASGYLGYPIESAQTEEIHDGGHSTLVLRSMAPISGDVVVDQYETYDTWSVYTGTNRVGRGNILRLSTPLYRGWDNIRVTYTTGWSAATLPADLKNALVSLASTKFRATETPSGTLKKVSSGAYTEEYSVSAEVNSADIPADVLEVVNRYRTPTV